MKPLTDATLRVRDAIYEGLLIRKGEALTEELCRERANNICTAVIETIIQGLQIEIKAKRNPGDVSDEPPPVRSRYYFDEKER